MEAAGFCFFESFFEGVYLRDGVLGDGLIDAGEVLIDDTTGAKIEVADLGIAHLAFGEADIHAGCGKEGTRIFGKRFVGERGVAEEHGVAIFFSGFFSAGVGAPAIADDKYYWFLGHAGCLRCGLRMSKAGFVSVPSEKWKTWVVIF